MLAYSAIVNSGFILLGLSTGTVYGLFASIYYLVIYICGMIHIFSILIIIRKTGSKLKLKNLVDFSGITHSIFF
jgi:NADH:ubiquinone oxidoreductase subunit 2 (subunit N)